MACTLDKSYNRPTTDPPVVTQQSIDLKGKIGDLTVEQFLMLLNQATTVKVNVTDIIVTGNRFTKLEELAKP